MRWTCLDIYKGIPVPSLGPQEAWTAYFRLGTEILVLREKLQHKGKVKVKVSVKYCRTSHKTSGGHYVSGDTLLASFAEELGRTEMNGWSGVGATYPQHLHYAMTWRLGVGSARGGGHSRPAVGGRCCYLVQLRLV